MLHKHEARVQMTAAKRRPVWPTYYWKMEQSKYIISGIYFNHVDD